MGIGVKRTDINIQTNLFQMSGLTNDNLENREELNNSIQNQINNNELNLINDSLYYNIENTKLQKHIDSCVAGTDWIKPNYDFVDYIEDGVANWKDIPGWINDAQWIFKETIDKCKDGDIVVEIGTYFGQSACYMGELIKNSKKSIKFDTFDTFELDASMYASYHPQQFINYRFNKKEWPWSELIKFHFRKCGLLKYINLIVCDGNYAYKFYDDNSLMLVYMDGICDSDNLYNFISNFWPKLKCGGVISGDDILFKDVQNAVKRFCEDYNLDYVHDVKKTEMSWLIMKPKFTNIKHLSYV
jgi:predicted O-methyltransferase YrrM